MLASHCILIISDGHQVTYDVCAWSVRCDNSQDIGEEGQGTDEFHGDDSIAYSNLWKRVVQFLLERMGCG